MMPEAALFHYDQQAPLELMVVSARIRDGAIMQDIAYASPLGGKVSGYLILPLAPQPQAGLIFGHWGQGNRDEFVDEALVLTQLGIVSLCLDASFRRPASYAAQQEPAQADLQWILDVRRGVDLLLDRFAIPPEHLGYVGHSYGASFGGVIAGIEHRINAFVFMAGGYASTEIMRTSQHPLIVSMRNALAPDVFAAMLAAEAPFDAHHYIGHAAPAALFFQCARHDDFVTMQESEHYFALASEPKQIAWYDHCNHELSAQARLERVDFLCDQLEVPRPTAEIRQKLEQMPSPSPLED